MFFHGRRLVLSIRSQFRQGRISDLSVFLNRPTNTPDQPLVSVIVPCYNHAPYLQARLESIVQQSYRTIELILLDDHSSDGSQELLRQFSATCPLPVTLQLNSSNSGNPFTQWQRGLELARGALIWIAESDDSCDPNFLDTLVPLFDERGVMLAFANTVFTDASGTRPVWSLAQYLSALPASTWRKPFTLSCHRLVELIWSRRNIIPNVSSCLFRAASAYPLLADARWRALRVCGDWLWYLQLARGGLVSYSPRTTNYYRQHCSNTSVSQHHEERFFYEHLSVADWVLEHFKLSPAATKRLQHELRQRWASHHEEPLPEAAATRISTLGASPKHQANVLIVSYALVPGGGEVFPLQLANGLHARGYGVTVLNCNQLPAQPSMAAILDPEVPLLTLRSFRHLGRLVGALGIELVHTHHAWVDTMVSEVLLPFRHVRQVITSHGMYDAMEPNELQRIGRLLRRLAGAAYVAAKNRPPLLAMGLPPGKLQAIANAAPERPYEPVSRAALGLADNAFVVTVVSRAIAQKGWAVAIAAVTLVRQRCDADVQLLLVGDGPEAAALRQRYQHLDFVQFVGLQRNSRPWYACADLGLLPSWFDGESQPLTLIECLQTGRPFVASDIGDIATMLNGPDGIAGTLVPLRDGVAEPGDFADAIEAYLQQPQRLQRHQQRCAAAAARFSWDAMLDAYEQLYARALDAAPNAAPLNSPELPAPLAKVVPGAGQVDRH